MHTFFLGIGFGLVTASILAIPTVGLSLQYSVSPIPNFALGEIMTIGAYTAYEVHQHLTSNEILDGIAAALVGGLAALLLNASLIQPLLRRRAARLVLLILTLATAIIIQNALQIIFGAFPLSFHTAVSPARSIGPLLLTSRQLGTIALAIVLLIFVHLLLRYTQLGRAIRAVADAPELAETSGINSISVVRVTWALSGMLIGISGYVLALTVGVVPTLGFGYLFLIFTAAIVGGIGQPYGAVVGAVLLGLLTEVSVFYIPPAYKTVLAFIVLIIALLLRPQGLFPRRTSGLSV